MFLQNVLRFLNLRFESIETESSYTIFQTELQKKLFNVLRVLLVGSLFFSLIYSIFRGHDPLEIALKTFIPTCILLVSLFKDKLIDLHNCLFIMFYWIIGFVIPPHMMRLYGAENSIALFFVGYFMGILEVIIAFSIKNVYYRMVLQATLIIGKVLNFPKYLSEEPEINASLWLVSFVSILFFLYHNGLERNNFRVIHDLSQKLQKFQTFLADDFPISVLVITSDLASLIYTNQCFRDTFGDLHKTPSPERFVRELFRKIFLEVINNKEETKIENEKLSLFHYIQSLNDSAYFKDKKDIINAHATYDKDEDRLCSYEIKIRRVIWEEHPAYTIIIDDISDKQQILALKIADEQKDRVIATISHELKTPINGIFGLLEIVTSQVQNEETLMYLDHCKSCSKLLLHFVNSVLDLCQTRENRLQLNKTTFNLDELLKEVKSLYTFFSEHKGINFIVEKGQQVPSCIYTDRYRLVEVLMLLLSNAMKFTFSGSVKLKVALELETSPKLAFYIEDTGVGIQEDEKRNLFNMFGKLTQSKRNINLHGAGFGLSVAGQLVKALNTNDEGQIHFKSDFGQGSTFWFTIDIAPEAGQCEREINVPNHDSQLVPGILGSSVEAVKRNVVRNRSDFNISSIAFPTIRAIHSQPNHSEGPDLHQKKILIVDDNPFNLVAASFIIKKLGYLPETADHGQDCLRMLQESIKSKQNYVLILMDIQMPVMDGLQVSEIINEKIRKGELYPVPIVALTAKKIDKEDLEKYQKCRLFDALEKPLMETELKRILKRLSERHSKKCI